MNRLHHITAGLALVAAAGHAQLERVVPQEAANQEANTRSSYPFHYARSRMQQVFDRDAVSRLGTAIIRSFQFRRDATGTLRSYAIKAVTVTDLTVRIGYSSAGPKTLGRTFASNWKGSPIVAFKGKLDLPFQPKVVNHGPFNVEIKLAAPFVYRKSNGNLLLEFVSNAAKQRYTGYWLDAAQRRSYATYYIRGMSGPMSDGRRYLLSIDTAKRSSGVPGGAVHIHARGFKQQIAAAWFLGFSSSQWGPFRLPLDLGALGAPGNNLYTGIDAIGAMTVTKNASYSYYEARATMPIPNIPSLGGRKLWTQAIYVDAKANPLGLVFSNLLETELGGGSAFAQMVATSNPTATSGYVFYGRSAGGLVVRFSGVL